MGREKDHQMEVAVDKLLKGSKHTMSKSTKDAKLFTSAVLKREWNAWNLRRKKLKKK